MGYGGTQEEEVKFKLDKDFDKNRQPENNVLLEEEGGVGNRQINKQVIITNYVKIERFFENRSLTMLKPKFSNLLEYCTELNIS